MRTDILNTIASEFFSSKQHQLKNEVFEFKRKLENYTCTAKEAALFQGKMQSILSKTDPEAQYWLECINEMVEAVMARVRAEIEQPNLCHKGSINVRKWDKRRWNDAPAKVKQTINSYIENGWNLEKFDTWQNKGFDCELEQIHTISNRAWTHYKVILILNSGKIETIGNRKTLIHSL